MNGYFLRGALTQGPICLTDEIIFGRALVECYQLESKASIVPRVILTEPLSEIGTERRACRMRTNLCPMHGIQSAAMWTDGGFSITWKRLARGRRSIGTSSRSTKKAFSNPFPRQLGTTYCQSSDGHAAITTCFATGIATIPATPTDIASHARMNNRRSFG